MSNKPEHLACGCCGASFLGEQSDDNDNGFGTCQDCVTWIGERDNKRWRRSTAHVAMALNKTNRRDFLRMDTELQRGIICQMIEDGIVTFAVTKH
jgi:hypothetical protein